MSAVMETTGMDIERFTRPISAEKPAGEWLRYDPVYGQLREARREDDATVPQGQWTRELKRADWNGVAALCLEVLEKRSRDLQVAAWLMEAWIRQRGFGGARDAMALMAAMCQAQWESLFPPLEPDDADARNAPFVWVNEKLSILLTLVPITAPETADSERYDWADLQEALRREARAEGAPAPTPRRGDPPPEAAEGPTRTRFAASVSLTPAAFYGALAADTAGAHAAAARLQEILDARLGKDGPTLGRLLETLRQVAAWAADEAEARRVEAVSAALPAWAASETARKAAAAVPSLPAWAASAPEPAAPTEEPMDAPALVPAPPAFAPRAAGPVNSREEAYRRLGEAAEYLMRTEPHSPTPYLVRRAVAWGGKSLADLIEEFLRDGYDLKTLRVFLGLVDETKR
ncbi:type VI secretion system protein TssA [Longimicrobium sp.]|uniref:type VI secretion system protein TssA n=1 Tax=Longimicrobium sp. TaxID=2029185 RepID=UPI002D093FC6|nr:type VI secretion system protein TssA [Longimicrobium sp.]HSU13838.1 type VI secretion system protein TssA [Longimicrobium sp.]